tara:strand:+ start:7787 stop:8998 length:1212 start_codon:yes stop_codon:yes gene_type:complete
LPVFAYTASDAAASVHRGTLAADTPVQAREQLRAQGLVVLSLAEDAAKRTGAEFTLPTLWSRIRPRTVAEVVRELSTLLGVGIPLLEALDISLEQQTGPMERCLLQIREQVSTGSSLSEAMRATPEAFDDLAVHMVEVGENAGNLDDVLGRLADFRERAFELQDKVLTALLYPLVVLVCAVGVSVFLMTVVVPMLLQNLVDAGRELPWPTIVLKAGSDFLVGHWVGLLVVVTLTTVGTMTFLRSDRGKRTFHRFLLRLPLVGEMARKQGISRAAMVICVLLRSGVELLRSFEIAARSIDNVVLREALIDCSEEVGMGVEIGVALQRTNVFPPAVVQVFAVGQQTGRLEDTLDRLAKDYEKQVNTLSMRLMTLLEPILILVLSAFVGFILFATVLPILEAGNVL